MNRRTLYFIVLVVLVVLVGSVLFSYCSNNRGTPGGGFQDQQEAPQAVPPGDGTSTEPPEGVPPEEDQGQEENDGTTTGP